MECSGLCWYGRNKTGKKEKTKEKSVGTWVEEKKRGKLKKKKKKKKEGEPTCVERKKERKKRNYITVFTINLKAGYY